MPDQATKRGAQLLGAFRHRDYRAFAIGSALSLTGLWVQRVAVGWLVWHMTESAAWLGIIAFADLFPSLLLSPLGGAIADRHAPRRIAMLTQALAMGQAALLCLLSAMGRLDIWSLLTLTVLRGCVSAMDHPARLSIIPYLAPRDALAAVVATTSVIFNVSRFMGAALASLIIVQGGVTLAFAVNALGYLAYIYALFRLSIPAARPATPRKQTLLSQMADGHRYVMAHGGIRPLLVLFLASTVLIQPVSDVLPAFAERVFAAGVSGLAAMTSAIGLGAVIGGLVMMYGLPATALFTLTLGGVALMGASVTAFCLVDSFPAALVFLTLCGLGMSINGIGTQTLMQTALDDRLRGRVMSLYGMIFRGGPAVGAPAIGFLADHAGLRAPVAGAALICLLFLGRTALHRAKVFAALTPMTSAIGQAVADGAERRQSRDRPEAASPK